MSLGRPDLQVSAMEVAGVEDPELARQSATKAVHGATRRIAEVHPTSPVAWRRRCEPARFPSYMPDRAAPMAWVVTPIPEEDGVPPPG